MENKNIHVIPTDKPSSLYSLNIYSGLRFSKTEISKRDTHTPKNIYITNLEKTKLGEWVIYTNGIKIHCQKLDNKEDVELANIENSGVLKIILTTDADLIKDGVQPINDEFLEWFVKNPSCEEVEVERKMIIEYEPIGHAGGVYVYKIIIPKEELKQKETFKEVAERILLETVIDGNNSFDLDKDLIIKEDVVKAMIQITKWQQEQILDFLYSEITERRDYSASKMCEKVVEFIEQFKNKTL